MAVYCTLQEIIEEAGLSHAVLAEIPNGIVDGQNKTFTVNNKPLSDLDYDDMVTEEDLRVYFDGVPVTVVDVDEVFGTITTAEAPKEGVTVTVDYRYSPVSMESAKRRREEAQATINNRMKSIDNCAPYGREGRSVPKIVRNITRQLAAAWLLIRDYGYNQDIEGTSKDGYERLKTAKEALEDYAKSGGECGIDSDGQINTTLRSLGSASKGDLFTDTEREILREHRRHRHNDDRCF